MLGDFFVNLKKRGYEKTVISPYLRKSGLRNREICQENTIAVFGHPRGGTTWLAEILSNLSNGLLIDVPLWRGFYRCISKLPGERQGKIKDLAKLGFYFDQPIPEQAKWPGAFEVFRGILTCKYSHYDLYDLNKNIYVKSPDKVIVKFCYGHLLLNWMLKNFSFKAVVLHRHPCAVVSSQLSHPGFSGIYNQPGGKVPAFRFNDIYLKHETIFETLGSPEEYLAAIWSIKTKYTGNKNHQYGNLISVYYENLISCFKDEMARITGHTKLEVPSSVSRLKYLISSSTRGNSKEYILKNEQLGSWKERLSAAQVYKILSTVEKFGIDCYDDSVMPKKF